MIGSPFSSLVEVQCWSGPDGMMEYQASSKVRSKCKAPRAKALEI